MLGTARCVGEKLHRGVGLAERARSCCEVARGTDLLNLLSEYYGYNLTMHVGAHGRARGSGVDGVSMPYSVYLGGIAGAGPAFDCACGGHFGYLRYLVSGPADESRSSASPDLDTGYTVYGLRLSGRQRQALSSVVYWLRNWLRAHFMACYPVCTAYIHGFTFYLLVLRVPQCTMYACSWIVLCHVLCIVTEVLLCLS